MGKVRLFRDKSLIYYTGIMDVNVPCLEEPLDIFPSGTSNYLLEGRNSLGL